MMAVRRTALGNGGQLYVGLVASIGIGVVLHSLYELFHATIGYQWFLLAGLTLLSGSFTIKIPSIPAKLSVSETFVFAAAILFGPAAATVIVVLDSLIISLWLRRSSRSLSRVLFNMSAPAVAIWIASHVFFRAAAVPPLYLSPRPILSLVVPLLLLALLYFLLNSWLIAGAVGFEKRISPFRIWRDNFLWLSLNYFSGASVAALLLPYLRDDQHAFLRVGGILLPLLLISYLTFKTALGRVEDANRHLSELNTLYLSTIETLAMAIDAKDQITHGHIRRVQHYAVALATKMGITDPSQIKAIEAASLLHDMGKLAVPEYILNKPGKLTPMEFEKMKLHASVGADILSAIDFPYPVVPIVRHHHENWDGTGYPDGLQASEIPIGARILSVVDCYDALTSDRPYRPRLSNVDALRILAERRGSMYDPLVVDIFVQSYRAFAPPEVTATITPAGTSDPGFSAIIRERRQGGLHSGEVTGFDDIAASSEEMLVLFDLARTLGLPGEPLEAAAAIAQHVRRVIPVTTCVIYRYDIKSDELVSFFATGEHAAHFNGLRIPQGQRLTGWVAANRQTILNSDAVLDLGDAARVLRPRLRSCLSTPLAQGGDLVGVLSLYTVSQDGFSKEHRRIAEMIARQATGILRQKFGADNLSASQTSPAPESGVPTTEGLSVALIQLKGSIESRTDFSKHVPRHVVEVVRQALRGSDPLFSHDMSDLIVLLSNTSVPAASEVARRIVARLHANKLAPAVGSIGVATAPFDGTTLDDLVLAARERARTLDDFGSSAIVVH